MQKETLTQYLKKRANQLGFTSVGITSPEPPPHHDVYLNWLEQGRHGDMVYLNRPKAVERRADPRRILPECRSILVLTANYLPGKAVQDAEESTGRISSYAQGEDYHEVLIPRISELMTDFQSMIGSEIPFRAYTDTGPLLERELAMRAGLGWIGKNTCLIHPRLGSYFFIAEVLLGIELEYDLPISADFCGSCTRCIQACPTNCILPNRTLDTRRCISYLTIETKSGIPWELRKAVGNWIFGCDICQDVCPWNLRFARPTTDHAFQSRTEFANPNLADFLSMDDREYQSITRGSPLKRAKRLGLQRNATVVAGNMENHASVPVLKTTLIQNPNPMLRAHAAWALAKIMGDLSNEALRIALSLEEDPMAVNEIELALASSGAKR